LADFVIICLLIDLMRQFPGLSLRRRTHLPTGDRAPVASSRSPVRHGRVSRQREGRGCGDGRPGCRGNLRR
jgi:hypothetical protein